MGTLPSGGIAMREDAPWDPWRPERAAERLELLAADWAVAGGWAIDLFLGEETRPHEDLEIVVPAAEFGAVREALPGFEFHVVGDGRAWDVDDGEAFALHHQTWVWEPAAGTYRMDVFREPHEGEVWICRRDAALRRPYADVIRRTADGVPYVAPEIVLLFKAKAARPKDAADFAAALPRLDPAARAWLSHALALVHPGHAWQSGLG